MMKPAFLFDGRMVLDHQQLADMGYIVETIGNRRAQFLSFFTRESTVGKLLGCDDYIAVIIPRRGR